MSSPASSVLRGAPTSCRSSRTRFASRSRAGTTLVRLSFLPSESDASLLGPGLFSPGSPTGFEVEAQDLPSSRATRLAHVPCSLTPVGPRCWRGAAFGLTDALGPHDALFRGCITRPARSLSTLRGLRRRSPRKTRYRPALALAGRDSSRWVAHAGFRVSPSTPPPAPSFLGAPVIRCVRRSVSRSTQMSHSRGAGGEKVAHALRCSRSPPCVIWLSHTCR